MASKYGVDTLITRLMLEISLMLAEVGRFDEAISVARAVKSFRDEIPHPGICLGVVHLFKGDSHEGVRQMQATLRDFPEHPLVLAMLGTALRETHSPEWRAILHQVLHSGTKDRWAVNLANAVLDMSDPGPGEEVVSFRHMRKRLN